MKSRTSHFDARRIPTGPVSHSKYLPSVKTLKRDFVPVKGEIQAGDVFYYENLNEFEWANGLIGSITTYAWRHKSRLEPSVYVKAAKLIHSGEQYYSCFALCGAMGRSNDADFTERKQYEEIFGFEGTETAVSLLYSLYSKELKGMSPQASHDYCQEFRVMLLLLAAQIFAE